MFRLSGLCLILLSCVLGGALFWTSQSVQRAEKRLGSQQVRYEQMQEALRVLTAEWDYLNRPDRIEALLRQDAQEKLFMKGRVVAVSDMGDVPEPMMPVLPSMKPAYIHTVSSSRNTDLSGVLNNAIGGVAP